jgi:hypothetical protein
MKREQKDILRARQESTFKSVPRLSGRTEEGLQLSRQSHF